MNQSERLSEPKTRSSDRAKVTGILIILAFSVFYAFDVGMRATAKAFWFDELFTYYICRLPSFHDSWQAVLHGVDLNPPLFYILTRFSLGFLAGPVGARLPEIVGFGVLCLCLFRFVAHRAGNIAGSIAMVFPLLTGAFYYACEARPHGIVLGFCGLALVSWQMTLDRPRAAFWNLCFGAALACAFLTHCYAIVIGFPFAVAELVIWIRTHRIRWATWTAIAIPGGIAVLVTLRLLDVYKGLTTSTTFSQLFPPDSSALAGFYIQAFGHVVTLAIVLLPLLIYRFARPYGIPHLPSHAEGLPSEELALAVAFVALPALGLVLAKVMHGPFVGRYFMSAIIGVGVLLGYSLPSRDWWASSFPARIDRMENLPALLLLLIMIAYAAKDLRQVVRARHEQGPQAQALVEPSSATPISMVAGNPLALDELVIAGLPPKMPIAVVDPEGFLPLAFYAPALAPRLFHVSWKLDDSVFPLERNLQQQCHVGFNDPISSRDFLRSHRGFAVYGRPPYLKELSDIVTAGAQVRQLYVDKYHFLAYVEVSTSAHENP
jgi:hypothetical protein